MLGGYAGPCLYFCTAKLAYYLCGHKECPDDIAADPHDIDQRGLHWRKSKTCGLTKQANRRPAARAQARTRDVRVEARG